MSSATDTPQDIPRARAQAKHVRTAPQKMRIVVDLVRGMPVVEARRILDFSPKASAAMIRKTIDSAVANSENGELGLTAEELYVERIYVDEGPMLKRWMPRARGRATRIRKRTSHLTVEVAEIPEEV